MGIETVTTGQVYVMYIPGDARNQLFGLFGSSSEFSFFRQFISSFIASTGNSNELTEYGRERIMNKAQLIENEYVINSLNDSYPNANFFRLSSSYYETESQNQSQSFCDETTTTQSTTTSLVSASKTTVTAQSTTTLELNVETAPESTTSVAVTNDWKNDLYEESDLTTSYLNDNKTIIKHESSD